MERSDILLNAQDDLLVASRSAQPHGRWLRGLPEAEIEALRDAVDVVREIDPEYGQVMSECLVEFGFDAEDGGSSLDVSFPSEQEGAYRLAAFTCEARYPFKPVYYQP